MNTTEGIYETSILGMIVIFEKIRTKGMKIGLFGKSGRGCGDVPNEQGKTDNRKIENCEHVTLEEG